MIEMKFDAEFDMSKWLTRVKNKKLRGRTGNSRTRGVAALRPIPRSVPGKTAASWAVQSHKRTKRGINDRFGTTQTLCPRFRLRSFCNTGMGRVKAATSR